MGKAVVLLSGGIDSTTTLAIAIASGFEPHALTFRYGQRHETEIEAARRVAEHFRVKQHLIAPIDLRQFGGSALTSSVPVPKSRSMEEIGTGIPVTYVPARNTISVVYVTPAAVDRFLAAHRGSPAIFLLELDFPPGNRFPRWAHQESLTTLRRFGYCPTSDVGYTITGHLTVLRAGCRTT